MDLRKLIVVCTLPLLLSGCIGAALIAGAGAGALGGTVAYDNRSIHNQFSDRMISDKATNQLMYNNQLQNKSNISVATYNGVVLLIGQVQTPELKQYATEVVQKIEGVKKTYNELEVSGSESTFASLGDSWLTSKVKAMLVRREGVPSTQIKVVTEDGIVYLMGIISKEQANQAADAARRVDGVRKVVEVFEYRA